MAEDPNQPQWNGNPAFGLPTVFCSHTVNSAGAATGLVNWYDMTFDPEGYFDGRPSMFVASVDRANANKNVVSARWKLAPCESPSGLAIDRKHHRLFSVCENEIMAVVDATNGKVVTTVPTGKGTDAAAFDDEKQLAFASNGQSGTLTVIHESSPDKYEVVENVATQRSARTMALDTKTHHIFLPAAKFGEAPAATEKNPRPRPPVVPGSFELLEVAP